MSGRRADEEGARSRQQRELKEKTERSALAVEGYRQEQAHKNMLTKELARLREDDMKKVHSRAKRLEARKKIEIMSREQKTQESVLNLKSKEQRLVDFRYQNKVKLNVEKEEFSKTMDNWAQDGYSPKKLPTDQVPGKAPVDGKTRTSKLDTVRK